MTDAWREFRPSNRAWLTAGLLAVFELWIAGQGILALCVLLFGVPILLLRALAARADPGRMRQRAAGAAIIGFAALAGVLTVRADVQGARTRAQRVIDACEAFRAIKGRYPEQLNELVPDHLPVIPTARSRGLMVARPFQYLVAGPNAMIQSTNAHVLIYAALPPRGRIFYVFEERRWGSYD